MPPEHHHSPFSKFLATGGEPTRQDDNASGSAWPRYSPGMTLEVKVGDLQGAEPRFVSLYNFSSEGLTIWSEEAIPSGAKMFVHAPTSDHQWVRTEAVRCVPGIGRHLIGFRFLDDEPLDFFQLT